MKKHTFISYTIRDGYITNQLLSIVKEHYNHFGTTFVDLLDNDSKLKQERVFHELNNANLFVLINTPAICHSPWVEKEIEAARKRMIPIINLTIQEIKEIQKQKFDNENYNLFLQKRYSMETDNWNSYCDSNNLGNNCLYRGFERFRLSIFHTMDFEYH